MYMLASVTWSPTEKIDIRFVLGDLPRVAWHGKEEGRSQMIGWDPKNGSGDSVPSAEIDTKKS